MPAFLVQVSIKDTGVIKAKCYYYIFQLAQPWPFHSPVVIMRLLFAVLFLLNIAYHATDPKPKPKPHGYGMSPQDNKGGCQQPYCRIMLMGDFGGYGGFEHMPSGGYGQMGQMGQMGRMSRWNGKVFSVRDAPIKKRQHVGIL